jgi:dipeptidyl aminopeptidase/acylaminoacyl peptidase
VVFEGHCLLHFGNGVICTCPADGSQREVALTFEFKSSRQPSWSPTGEWISFQRERGGHWDVWIMRGDGSDAHNLAADDPGEKTDATFSPNGEWVVYSSDNGELELVNIFVKPASGGEPIRVTYFDRVTMVRPPGPRMDAPHSSPVRGPGPVPRHDALGHRSAGRSGWRLNSSSRW